MEEKVSTSTQEFSYLPLHFQKGGFSTDKSSVRSQTSESMEESQGGLERMGSGISVLSGPIRELDRGDANEMRKNSLLDHGKLPSSQYKGVVPQPNGRWGAQIYEKHQRVWLGTFNREEEAARAYDRAALKLRGHNSITNFGALENNEPEARFLRKHTKSEIVDMLRKHTYDIELLHYSNIKTSAVAESIKDEEDRNDQQNECGSADCSELSYSSSSSAQFGNSGSDVFRENLFDKAVTPSDVGKLNRLVIPKQHAEKYFPMNGNPSDKGLLLDFEDNGGKAWRFRYSYWNSSQSYVLTKGWSGFVKDKKLQPGDVISFHKGTHNSPRPNQLYITWRRRGPCVQENRSPKSKLSLSKVCGSLSTFHSAQQISLSAFIPQWTHIFCPISEWPLGQMDAAMYPSIPLCVSAPVNQTDHNRFHSIESNGSGNPYIGLNRINPPAAMKNPQEKKDSLSSSQPTTMKTEVRLFGVNLADSQTIHGDNPVFEGSK